MLKNYLILFSKKIFVGDYPKNILNKNTIKLTLK